MTMHFTELEAAEARAHRAEEDAHVLVEHLRRQAQTAHDLYSIVTLAHRAVEAYEELAEAMEPKAAQWEHLAQDSMLADLIAAVARIKTEFDWRAF